VIPYKILISGAGQLGSRYLQGLASCRYPLSIIVQDKSQDSLDRARQRWSEVINPECTYNISFQLSLNSIPESIDIAIVATNADVRSYVVRDILRHTLVRYWVLEKVLSQDKQGLDEIAEQLQYASGAWVNTSRRMMSWHQNIRSTRGFNNPMTFNVNGGDWGLACNAIHFLDLFAWWSGETLESIDVSLLSAQWKESKRLGYKEITGMLQAKYSGGSSAKLSANSEKEVSPILIEISDGNLSWFINETAGTAKRSDGLNIHGSMLNQSKMSTSLVESIIANGSCDLPCLAESIAMHRIFIGGMLAHYRQMHNSDATFIPIT